MSDIFKDMQANVGCDYISNLPSYKRKVWHEMKRLPLTNYDIKQLEDFSKYVFGMSLKYSQQSRHIFKKYFTEDRINPVPNKWIPFHLVLDSQENHEASGNCRILQCIQKQKDAVH